MSPQKYATSQRVVYLIARDRKISSNSKWMLLSSRQLKRDALKWDVKIDSARQFSVDVLKLQSSDLGAI